MALKLMIHIYVTSNSRDFLNVGTSLFLSLSMAFFSPALVPLKVVCICAEMSEAGHSGDQGERESEQKSNASCVPLERKKFTSTEVKHTHTLSLSHSSRKSQEAKHRLLHLCDDVLVYHIIIHLRGFVIIKLTHLSKKKNTHTFLK